jgi:tRNA G10  N-methylase Trm11
MILSAMIGNNSDIFPQILALYVPVGSKIADVTYGNGVFWAQIDCSKYTLLKSDIQMGIDARKLPYNDNSIDCIVIDPPYIYSPMGTIKESISRGYALNAEKGGILLRTQEDVLELYRLCLKEGYRVLKSGGITIIKTKDTVQSGKQVWMHRKLMAISGFTCEDLFILIQKTVPASDPKWIVQRHARKNHSFFIVLRKQ